MNKNLINLYNTMAYPITPSCFLTNAKASNWFAAISKKSNERTIQNIMIAGKKAKPLELEEANANL